MSSEQSGSSKTLNKSITMMRKALKRRGPRPKGSLRAYHNSLMADLAKAKPKEVVMRHLK